MCYYTLSRNKAQDAPLQASDIVQLILDHGKLRPPDVISRLSIYDPKSLFVRSAERIHPDCWSDTSLYSQSLYKLVSEAYLKPSTVLSHQSPRDKRLKYEADEKAKLSGLPTARELREAKETADARLKREEEEAEKVGLVCFMFIGHPENCADHSVTPRNANQKTN